MMAYNSEFVLAVLHNGSPVREIGETIHLPFHSEYKIRLKNKHSFLRSKARVWIDGRQVSNLGDFILHPNGTLDLERFLDHSMSSGNKFKFVPLSDSRVNDPTDSENGIIKVEFYREKKWEPPQRPIQPFFLKRGCWSSDPGWNNSIDTTYISNNNVSNCSVNLFSQTIAPQPDSFVEDSAGATVGGGYSGQSFVHVSDFLTETYPVTLELKIRGIERNWENNSRREWHRPCGHKPKQKIRFCPNCGAKRHRMADKFCHRCGTAYHPRYERERGKISPK